MYILPDCQKQRLSLSAMSSHQHDGYHNDTYQTFGLPYQSPDYDPTLEYPPQKRGCGCFGGGCCLSGCCLGCLGIILLVILGCVLLWYCILSGGVPLTVGEHTTIITEPLKDDGTVDFHRAIQEMIVPDIDASENGFRDVLRGFGQEVFEFGNDGGKSMWQFGAMCESLGIDPPPVPTFSLRIQNAQQTNAGLDAVQAAASKPHYCVPLVRREEKDLVATSLPFSVYAFHGALSGALRKRAASRFDSDTDGAWKDMLASIRLFRHVTINDEWRNSIAVRGNESLLTPVADVVETLEHWTPAQLTQAIKDLESLPAWQDRQTTLTVMQFTVLDMLSTAHDIPELARRFNSHELPDDMPQEALQVFGFIGFDWNLFAVEMNSQIKRYESALEQSAGQDIDKQFELLHLREMGVPRRLSFSEEDLQKKLEEHFVATGVLEMNPLVASGRSKLFGMLAGELIVDAAGEMYRLQIMEESRCQALRLALALERYHRENQTYPDTLDNLGLLPMTPNMSFRYEKQRDVGYRIQNRVFQWERE